MSDIGISGAGSYDESAVSFATYALVDRLVKLMQQRGLLSAEEVDGLYRSAADGLQESAARDVEPGREVLERAALVLLEYVENSPELTTSTRRIAPQDLVAFAGGE